MRARLDPTTLMLLLIATSAAPSAVCAQQTAAAATPVPPAVADITSIRIESSSWRSMRLDLAYQLPATTSHETISARWMRKNGRALAFTPARAAVEPGARMVSLTTTHKGVLPPPNEIVMHVEIRGSSGPPLAQYDCQLRLINRNGKDAWAGDVARNRPMRWTNKSCVKR